MQHVTVLLREVIGVLKPKDGGRYFDGTLGGGGHAKAILEASAPGGKLAGTDLDPGAIAMLKSEFCPYRDRVHLFHANFTAVDTICATLGWGSLSGIVLDLGLSSLLLDDPDRGFAFSKEGRLDMRFSPQAPLSAYEVVNIYSEEMLVHILQTYGEERFAPRIARAIVNSRPIETTTALAACIGAAIPRRFWPKRIHPATRTFQAIRMEVNAEIDNLEAFLPKAASLLEPEGVMAIVSFHSLEDRIVKHFFAGTRVPMHHPVPCMSDSRQEPILERIFKQPVTPSPAEIRDNPRARSARLRAARRGA